MVIRARTKFDVRNKTEVAESVKLTAKQAQEYIQSIVQRMSYEDAAKFVKKFKN